MIAVEAAPHIELEIHAGAAGLAALLPQWQALWPRVGATPFSRPEWLLPWARHLADGELLTLTLRDRERLVGLVPLSYRSDGLYLAGGEVSDYRDALIDPGLPGAVLAEALSAILQKTGAPGLHLCGLRPSSLLSAMPPLPGFEEHRQFDETCPAVPLPAAPGRLDALFAAHLRRDVARARRRLAGRAVRLESADGAGGEHLYDALVRLHEAEWQERGQAGVLHDVHVQAFHRDVVRAFGGDGLELHALIVDEVIIAVIYGFSDAKTAYYYLSAFDPNWAALSPGTLIIYAAMERAQAAGQTTFDFLRGAEPYKYRWGARDTFTERRSFTP